MKRVTRAAATALVVGFVLLASGWAGAANAATAPGIEFAHPATNPALAQAGRVFAASAGDASGTRTVLYGGQQPSTNVGYGDTWVNEPDGTWKPMCGTTVTGATAACGPGTRDGLGMADASGGVVLFGGFPNGLDNGNAGLKGDTWRWNGSTWSPVCTTANCGPGARGLVAMAGNGSTAVMFGGIGANTAFSDTWVFDGSTWTEACGQNGSPCGPSSLAGAAMAWDGKHFVLFGGADLSQNGTPNDDTWMFEGDHWAEVCGTSTGKPCGPSARDLSTFAFVNSADWDGRGAMLAEGGDIFGNGSQHLDRDAWFFDDAKWTQLDPPWNATPVSWSNNGSPPAGPDPLLGTMASKPAQCAVVYLGAQVLSSSGEPQLGELTYIGGRDLGAGNLPTCARTVAAPPDPGADPGVIPVVAPAPTMPDVRSTPTPAVDPAAAAPTLAMTGARDVGRLTFAGFGLLLIGLSMLVLTGRRAAVEAR